VAQVELAEGALADLDRLILTHSLPNDTRSRLRRSLTSLARFPRLGPELRGRWRDFRFVLGPWRWMLIVYAYLEVEDRVVVVTIQDARSTASATGSQ
jgi:plasmid stabilization system protein ParE